jgi:hypothetical protein
MFLAASVLLSWPVAAAEQPADLETRLGIPIFPGADLLTLEGPVTELVDLQRPGWEFIMAEVLVADFLVTDTIADLRRFYRPLCVRDKRFLLVAREMPEDQLVSVHHAAKHPLHPRQRWLRIVSYRRQAAPDQGEGE